MPVFSLFLEIDADFYVLSYEGNRSLRFYWSKPEVFQSFLETTGNLK